MIRMKRVRWFAAFLGALFVCASSAHAKDIAGIISTTLTITEDSQLVDDVNCSVTGAACIVIGAPHVTLELNGFTMTGLADPQTACGGAGMGPDIGIDVTTQMDANIRGPGLVKQFRGFGIRLLNSTGSSITGVTISTNCFSVIFVSGGSGHQLDRNIAVRNGNVSNPCGGI